MAAEDEEQPIVEHLLELRRRLLYVLIGVGIIAIPCFTFARQLFAWLSGPMLAQMPASTSMIATGVAAPVLAPFKLALVISIVISLPWTFYQIWMFVAPGLYSNERRLVIPLVATSTALFVAGMAFAYYVVFPAIFGFFVSFAPDGVKVATDISAYLSFVLKLFMAFGVAFEMPVAIYLLIRTGTVTPRKLKSLRPYVLVGVFIAGMLLTPPDVISQSLLAIPLYLLYEIGIFAGERLVPGIRDVENQQDEDSDDE